MSEPAAPLTTSEEFALIKEQISALQSANEKQEQTLAELLQSDARQYRLLRLQRKLQSACIAALALAIAVGFLSSKEYQFSTGNRETLERIVVAMITAAAAGHVGSNFVDKIPE